MSADGDVGGAAWHLAEGAWVEARDEGRLFLGLLKDVQNQMLGANYEARMKFVLNRIEVEMRRGGGSLNELGRPVADASGGASLSETGGFFADLYDDDSEPADASTSSMGRTWASSC